MAISPKKSSFLAAPTTPGTTLLDDGTTSATLTFTAKDASGKSVSGLTDIGFACSLTGVTIGAVAETPAASGIYIATATSTASGDAIFTVTEGGTPISTIAPQTLTFADHTASAQPAAGTIAGSHSLLDASPKSGATLLDDNTSTSTVTFQAKDASDAAVTGLTDITFTTNVTQATVDAVAETPANSGKYVAKVKSSKAGNVIVTANQGGKAIAGAPTVTLTFKHKVTDPVSANSTLTITPDTFANTSDQATISFVAKDSTGADCIGLTNVTFTTSGAGAATATVGTVTESSTTPGTYEADLSGTAAGAVTVGVKVGTKVITGLTANATIS